MAQISDNIIGVDFTEILTANTALKRRFRTGTTVRGDDGGVYQYARANATIADGNTSSNITVNGDGEYVAANSGGSAEAPGAMVSGQYGWFKIA